MDPQNDQIPCKSTDLSTESSQNASRRPLWYATNPTKIVVIFVSSQSTPDRFFAFLKGVIEAMLDQLNPKISDLSSSDKPPLQLITSTDDVSSFVATFRSNTQASGKLLSPKGFSLTKKLVTDAAIKSWLSEVCGTAPKKKKVGQSPTQLLSLKSTALLLEERASGCLVLHLKEAVTKSLDTINLLQEEIQRHQDTDFSSIKFKLETLVSKLLALPAIFVFWCHVYSNIHKLIHQGKSDSRASPSSATIQSPVRDTIHLSQSEHKRYAEVLREIAALIGNLEMHLGDSSWLRNFPKFKLQDYQTYWNQQLCLQPGDLVLKFCTKPAPAEIKIPSDDGMIEFLAKEPPQPEQKSDAMEVYEQIKADQQDKAYLPAEDLQTEACEEKCLCDCQLSLETESCLH